MKRTHPHSPQTLAAVQVLGLDIASARRARHQTVDDLAQRAGISRPTLRGIEHGSPTVAIGTVFEVATLLGIPLFGANSRDELDDVRDRARGRLALLPVRIRQPTASDAADDDF